MRMTNANKGDWPSSQSSMLVARAFLKDWCVTSLEFYSLTLALTVYRTSATRNDHTLLLPDKDADGLCASLIIYRTLVAIGLPASRLSVHFVAKGSNIHAAEEREKIEGYNANSVIAVDQGSRGGGPIARGDGMRALVVDHHWSEEFPENAIVRPSFAR